MGGAIAGGLLSVGYLATIYDSSLSENDLYSFGEIAGGLIASLGMSVSLYNTTFGRNRFDVRIITYTQPTVEQHETGKKYKRLNAQRALYCTL